MDTGNQNILDRAAKYILDKTNYNTMPEPYEEITEGQFWHHVLIWGFGDTHGFRQILPDNNPELFEGVAPQDRWSRNLHIIYEYNEAIAVMHTVEHSIPKPWKYFRIGCKHKKATGTDTNRGWHERHCPTCNLDWTWDSSD
jgi:hypothetical protein